MTINGRKLSRCLGIEIQGTPPECLSGQGDAAFERSRREALFALHKFEIEAKSRTSAEELVQTIHEIRTGERVLAIPLDECASKWAELPRRRPLAERYLSWALSAHHPLRCLRASQPQRDAGDELGPPAKAASSEDTECPIVFPLRPKTTKSTSSVRIQVSGPLCIALGDGDEVNASTLGITPSLEQGHIGSPDNFSHFGLTLLINMAS